MFIDPHSFSNLDQSQINHINFNFQVDFEKNKINAKNIYTFDRKITGSLFLDTRDLHISAIRQGGEDVEWSLQEKDKIKGQKLVISGLVNASSISIEYTIKEKARALQWLLPEQTAGKKHPFLFSQCQAIHARSVFPCQDTPAVRFTYEARISVPAPLKAVMSAERTEVLQKGDKNICLFQMPQAIPSYLFAFAVGNLTQKDIGGRSRIYAEPEVIDSAAWEFANTEKMIFEAEKLFGPYVWERFDMLLMPPSFPYGGMENPRLTFLTPTLLVGDRSMANVVTHELAHSWTGNLVTNATWEDFWLNEGWTVYAERRILEALEGEEYANLQGALRRNSMFKDMEVFGIQSKPTCLKFKQEGIDPDDVFSTIPYEKGYAFLNRIETFVGREKFDRFIINYIEKHKFKSLSTEDFIEYLLSELSEVKGHIDIRHWVYEPGFPEDAVPIKSKLLDAVFEEVGFFREEHSFHTEKIKSWKSEQKILFLQSLSAPLAIEELELLRKILNIDQSNNYSILSEFYQIGIKSDYEEILPGVEKVLSAVGRMLYLKPLYRSLSESNWSRDYVRGIFEKNRNSYHPIAASGLVSILEKAGL